MSKAQLATTDFYVALIIFIILLGVILLTLNNYTIRLDREQDKNEILLVAFQLSDALVKNLGTPSSWEDNATKLEVIGLAEDDHILSAKKVDAFINLSYNTTKVFIRNYDFYFRILDYYNNTLITYGMPFNGTSSVSTRRYVIYNNENAIMELTLWK